MPAIHTQALFYFRLPQNPSEGLEGKYLRFTSLDALTKTVAAPDVHVVSKQVYKASEL